MDSSDIIIIRKKTAAKILANTLLEGAVKKPKNNNKYDKPGQKYETPPAKDALRAFYTTLLEQRPDSQMALKWCLEHGLLSDAKATEAVLMFQIQKIKI
jgi:aryl-alcohol dehydrogenase-like predicted oxidoreductase